MVKRALLLASLSAGAACATVAGIDVNRAPDGSAPAATGSDDAGDRDPEGGAVVAEAGTDAAGDAPPSPGSCTCLMLGCVRASTDGRDCCWNPEGGLAKTSYAAGCANGRVACANDDDCKIYGGTCQKLSCGGSDIGVCGNSGPPAPPCP